MSVNEAIEAAAAYLADTAATNDSVARDAEGLLTSVQAFYRFL